MDSATQREMRKQRFKKEAKAGPPPLPERKMAHPGGRIVKGDADSCLIKLLERKANAGIQLTADQRRALEAVRSNTTNIPSPTLQQCHASHQPKEVPAGSRPRHGVIASSGLTALGEGATREQHSMVGKPDSTAVDTRIYDTRCIIKLRKKLRDIDELERREREEGAVLHANQKAKISNKATIQAELATLIA